ncbi:hypothetical protein HCH_06511 [Hahella chejuensis KCTC 2396]|uniref:Uncharacterized protein n=1 Tax=Hahella chejuensis (strain KCTC 2396) TaxID=349521 RepID=Q2S872_HAHCH|nr:hypothetical protein HCH_06511 [Hahella chejuensis KCTC 2396]
MNKTKSTEKKIKAGFNPGKTRGVLGNAYKAVAIK